jgi:flagellar motility protein MotE (MotC chaperone)
LPGRAADGGEHAAKPEAKAEAKPEVKAEAVGHGGAAPSTTGAGGAGAKSAAAEAPRAPRSRPRKSDDEPKLPPGQGPAAPSPLNLDGLKADLKRETSGGFNANASSRTKVEQLLAELIKTREALHQDTAKLENLAMGGEGAGADASAATAAPGAPAAAGQPPAKNPLDVLAKALRGIKPEQAAPIVARVDKTLAATVLLRMPPVDAGKIMGALKPETAAELATQIALRAPPTPAGGKR